MLARSILLALTAWTYLTPAAAAPYVEERGNAVCNSGGYAELVGLLRTYAPAQALCSVRFPVECTSVPVKSVVTSTTSTIGSTAPTSTTRTSTTTMTTTTDNVVIVSKRASTTVAVNPVISAFSKFQKQPGNIMSTVCACIEKPRRCSNGTTKSPVIATGSTSTTRQSGTSPTTASITTVTTQSPSSTTTASPSTTTPATTIASTTTFTTTAATTTSAAPTCTDECVTSRDGLRPVLFSYVCGKTSSNQNTLFSVTDLPDYHACAQYCANDSRCYGFKFFPEDACEGYASVDLDFLIPADSAVIGIVQGSCQPTG